MTLRRTRSPRPPMAAALLLPVLLAILGTGLSAAAGSWVVPGLVGAHVHFSQTGWADARPDSLDVRSRHPYPQVIDRLAAEEGVRYLAARGAHAAKVWYIDADRPADEMAAVVEAAGAEAERRGLPLIVHATKLELAKTALRAGADLLVHSVEDRPIDDECGSGRRSRVASALQSGEAKGDVMGKTYSVPRGRGSSP